MAGHSIWIYMRISLNLQFYQGLLHPWAMLLKWEGLLGSISIGILAGNLPKNKLCPMQVRYRSISYLIALFPKTFTESRTITYLEIQMHSVLARNQMLIFPRNYLLLSLHWGKISFEEGDFHSTSRSAIRPTLTILKLSRPLYSLAHILRGFSNLSILAASQSPLRTQIFRPITASL